MSPKEEDKIIIKCKYCRKETEDRSPKQNKRFCSNLCKTKWNGRKPKQLANKRKWRANNKDKYKFSVTKSMVRSLTDEQRKELFDEYKKIPPANVRGGF